MRQNNGGRRQKIWHAQWNLRKKPFSIAGNNEIENKIEKKVWELHKERGEKNFHLAQIATNYFGSVFC